MRHPWIEFRKLIVPLALLGALLAPIPTGYAVEPSAPLEKSSPSDTEDYQRPAAPSDLLPSLTVHPAVLLVNTVVSNTNANLNATDTANDGETSIGINPANPLQILVSAFRNSWGTNAPIMESTDGGLTWTEQFSVPRPTGWPAGCPCDQTYDYGRNNLFSGAFLANSPTVAGGGDIVSGTTTNPALAASWLWFDPAGAPVQAQETNINNPGSLGNPDQPWILVNRDTGNANQDNLYVAYDDFNNSDLRVAVSYGANPPNFTVDRDVGDFTGGVNPGLRLADDPRTGFMYALWGRCTGGCGADGPKTIDYMLTRTTDSGANWTLNGDADGIVVATATSTQPRPKFGTVNALLGGVHHAAVDPNSGDVYYVYGDRDGGTGNDRLSIRRLQGNAAGGLDIGAAHFVTGQVEAALPSVAVAGDGTVAVFYYTFDGFSSDGFPIFSAHLALSTDRAVTFEDQVLMTFLSSAIDNGNDRQRVLGDYMQMKTVGRVFYGAFTANGVQFGRPFANHDPIFFRTAIGPLIAVKAPLDFGDVCIGETELRQIEVFNTGTSDLIVSSVAPIAGSDPTFRVDPNPVRPVVIQPGSHVDFAVYCEPTTVGNHTATIRITSNDPDSPQFDVQATCTTPPGDIAVTGSTEFGQVCAAGAEKTIAICNVGHCDLNVTSVSFDPPCPDFTIINNPFPAVVSHDACVDLTIRFTPTSAGPKSCTLRIVSDDPDEPVIVLQVTADVPLASIDVPPDLGFPPTVTQDVGACHTLLEFPISNTGECPLVITNVAISGTNAGDFFLVGLPSFPIILEQGHIVGEGDFRVGFAPTVVARHREATLTVTFVTDPVSGATDDVARRLCGEGVRTGARVLVTNGATSYPVVKSLKIQRINANRNRTRLDTVESLKDVALVTVAADPPCAGFQYHREYGTETNPIQLLPGSYQVTAMVLDGARHLMKTVGFDVHTCDFNPRVVIDFGAPAMVAGDGSTQPGPSDENVPETTSLTGVHTDAQARAGSVSFDIAVGMAVRLEIFDVRGRLVRTLLSDDLEVGKYRVNWNGRDQSGGLVPRGVYLVRLVAGDMRETRKLVLAH